jgi:hypothetical protein
LKDGNELKRNIILEVLELSNSNELRNLDIQDFNKIFVSRENPSENEIESPSNWNIKQISENYKDNEDFINICKFKWSFNAKPDMVIHTSRSPTAETRIDGKKYLSRLN